MEKREFLQWSFPQMALAEFTEFNPNSMITRDTQLLLKVLAVNESVILSYELM